MLAGLPEECEIQCYISYSFGNHLPHRKPQGQAQTVGGKAKDKALGCKAKAKA